MKARLSLAAVVLNPCRADYKWLNKLDLVRVPKHAFAAKNNHYYFCRGKTARLFMKTTAFHEKRGRMIERQSGQILAANDKLDSPSRILSELWRNKDHRHRIKGGF